MRQKSKNEAGDWQLPELCIVCGAEGSYSRKLTSTSKILRGQEFTVQHHHWECSECKVGILGDVESDEAMAATVAAYQASNGLLTAATLRAGRALRGWTQSVIAEKARLGIATIKRIELGLTLQTQSNDQALREALDWAIAGDYTFTEGICFQANQLDESWNHDPPEQHFIAEEAAPALPAAAFAFPT